MAPNRRLQFDPVFTWNRTAFISLHDSAVEYFSLVDMLDCGRDDQGIGDSLECREFHRSRFSLLSLRALHPAEYGRRVKVTSRSAKFKNIWSCTSTPWYAFVEVFSLITLLHTLHLCSG